MTKQRLYIIIILALLFSFGRYAQAQVAATKIVTYNFCYPNAEAPLNNALLANLMSSLPKVSDKSCITFEATFSFKYRITGANYRTEIFCDEILVKHQIDFQQFNVAEHIIPIQTKFTVKIDEENKSFDHTLRSGIKVGELLTPDQPQTFHIEINSILVDNDVLSRVVEKQQHISEYYTADTQIKIAFEDLQTIYPDSVQYIDKYLEIARKNQNIVQRIRKKELYRKLNLGTHDPVNVYERLKELDKAIFDVKASLTKQSNNLSQEYLRLGIETLATTDTAVAIEYFDKAIEVDDKLAGAYVEKAKIDFNRKKLLDVISQVRFIDSHTVHHSGNRTDVNTMIKFIENSLIEQADKQNHEDHFYEALLLLDSAEIICNSIQVVVCSDMINVVRSHSYRGMLNQHIINWFDIISREQFSELPQVISETFEFRKQNNSWLTTNELIYVNLKIIQDTLLSMADRYGISNPSKALETLYAAREICNTYTEINCPPGLDEKFKNAFTHTYKQMLAEAKKAITDSLPNRADTIQRKAARYCRAQQIEIDQEHKRIIKQIAKLRYLSLMSQVRASRVIEKREVLWLDSLLTIRKRVGVNQANDETFHRTRLLTEYVGSLTDKAQRMIEADQFIIAMQLLGEVDWVVKRFGYVLSNEILTFIQTLRSRVGNQACFEKHRQYQIYMLAAEKFMSNNDYRHAKVTLEKAQKWAVVYKECGFDLANVKKILTRIEQPAYYQNKMEEIKQLAIDNRFDEAYAAYESIDAAVFDSILHKFNLANLKIDEIAIQINYMPFIQYVAKSLAQQGHPNRSFGLITLLYDSHYTRELTKDAQTELGASLAKEFFIKDPSVESAQLYLGYTLDKKWSKPFIKAYKKKWKEMQTSID